MSTADDNATITFLSTLSLRRATIEKTTKTEVDKTFLSTLSLRRATAQTAAESAAVAAFLSTLSLRRATFGHAVKIFVPEHFYPRSPCGERHAIVHVQCRGHGISIHALLAESDLDDCVALIPHQHFYPRSPCGERPMSCWNNLQVTIFLSTLSLRRATAPLDFFAQSNIIFLSTLSLRRAT